MQLRRSIGPISLLLTAVGGIVGSGWLFGPFYAAQTTGTAAILAWVLGGALMMVIALTFAELAAMFPVAGGLARFCEFSHGPFVGFTLAWVSWLSALIVAPIETMAILHYAGNYFPSFIAKMGDGHHNHVLTATGIFAAAIIMLVMCFLNAVGAKILARTTSGIVFIKLLIPVITIFVLFQAQFEVSNFFQGGFAPQGVKGLLSALPAAGIIFSFIGYNTAVQLAGEAKNPQKAVPFALIGAISICIILYALVQTAFIGAVDPASIKDGWQNLSFSGDAGPMAGVAAALGITWLVYVLYFDAIISPFGTGFIYTAATARLNYAMAKNRYFPQIFLRLNKKGIPFTAIMLNFVIGMLFFMPFPGWQDLVKFLVTTFVIAYAVGPIAVMGLRYTKPDQPRPFRLPAVKFMTALAFYICNLIIFWTGWYTVWRLLVLISVGFVLLMLYKLSPTGQKHDLQWRRGYWLFPYLLGLGFISYLGSFGGGLDVIPFGWDFVVLGVFAISIFTLAIKAVVPSDDTVIPDVALEGEG